jgi:hypothetical protein
MAKAILGFGNPLLDICATVEQSGTLTRALSGLPAARPAARARRGEDGVVARGGGARVA